MASVFNREKFEIGKEKEDRGKVRGTGRRQLMTEMTADRERTGRGSGGRGLEAGQTVSDSEDVREISLPLLKLTSSASFYRSCYKCSYTVKSDNTR